MADKMGPRPSSGSTKSVWDTAAREETDETDEADEAEAGVAGSAAGGF